MNNFQTVLVAIFLAFFVFGVLIFAGVINIGNKEARVAAGKVKIWGTLPNDGINDVIKAITDNNSSLDVSYSRKDKITYQNELIESFANGNGPDLFIITTDMIQKNLNFIYKIPYQNYSERGFRDSFIDGASVYLDKDGVIGFPLVVDPIVMYYNKDILSNEGIVNPPKTWDELFELNKKITQREDGGTINQSLIALGQYDNINNIKDILATLLIQNGNNIVERNESGYQSVFGSNPSSLEFSPAETVLKFFIEFSNPSSYSYSWNKSLPNSFDYFTGARLALYLGRASEIFNIETVNPNLSFDVAQVPQIKDTKSKRTYGDVYAIVINKNSNNLTSAFQVASDLSYGDNARNLSVALSLPPASRALLSEKPDNPYLLTFFNSALISRSWPDPDDNQTDVILSDLLDNILSNKLSIFQSINKVDGSLNIINKKNNPN